MFSINKSVHCQVTSVDQKIPKNVAKIAEEFLHDFKNIDEFANLTNMNETPCYFVIPRSSTIEKKKSTEGQSQDHKCQASLFHCSFNSRRKKQKLCFLLFTSLHHGYLKIWRMFLEVNIRLECKFLVPRVEKEKIHNERNLCESHLEEKVRWVFQHREVYSVNGFCQKLSWP